MNEFDVRSSIAFRPADRHPQLAADAEFEDERRGHHADDDVRLAVDLDGLADDRGVGAVAARPQARG